MRITRWGGGVALGLAAGALALASPAAAQDGHFPDAGWQVRDFTGTWVEAAESDIISPTAVELAKPAGDVGTSIETTDLGLPVEVGDVLSVSYELGGDATVDAGAIRMFYYDHPEGDTITEAPTATAIADGTGALTIEVAEPGTVGTFGLTYDASNASAGTVTFSDLEVAGTAVLFEAPPAPEPTTEPTAAPTTGPTAGPEPTDPAAPGQGGGGDGKPGLPVTGVSMLMVAGIGVALLAGGSGLWWLARRRRVSFTA